MEDVFVVVGGDARLAYAAQELERRSKKVISYGNGLCTCPCAESLKAAVADCTHILCGIPLSRDGGETVYAPHFGKKIYTEDLLSILEPHHTVYAGMAGSFVTSCAMRGANCIDYNIIESFQLSNAHLSAEAILALIISNLPISISDGRFLVLGYGRIGKALCDMLKAMGGEVSATARKESDFAAMNIKGIDKMHTSQINRGDFDAVVNTIPQKVTDDKFYEMLNSNCLIIDASASPGQIDKAAADLFGIKVMDAFGLPGKFSPKSAGGVIVNTVLS